MKHPFYVFVRLIYVILFFEHINYNIHEQDISKSKDLVQQSASSGLSDLQ